MLQMTQNAHEANMQEPVGALIKRLREAKGISRGKLALLYMQKSKKTQKTQIKPP